MLGGNILYIALFKFDLSIKIRIMASTITIRDFLHDVLSNRARARLTIEEFDSLLSMADQI